VEEAEGAAAIFGYGLRRAGHFVHGVLYHAKDERETRDDSNRQE
jgi:hypothetical protein